LVAGHCVGVTSQPVSRAARSAQDAGKILKAMSDYVAGQKVISAKYDSSVEVITPTLEKIQFASSGQMLLSRPDKLRATRTGGYADIELVFDGKTATLLGKNINAFAQFDTPGSVDQLVDLLRNQLSVELPGTDLLNANAYDVLMSDVIDAKHMGQGVIDGVDCEHLAFRNADTDWQVWVEAGPRPIPRKYVITSKAVAGALNTRFLSKTGRRTHSPPRKRLSSSRRRTRNESTSQRCRKSTKSHQA